jgi:hypothetical protein
MLDTMIMRYLQIAPTVLAIKQELNKNTRIILDVFVAINL